MVMNAERSKGGVRRMKQFCLSRVIEGGGKVDGQKILAGKPGKLEYLEGRLLLSGNPIITEFLASNTNAIDDGDGVSSDFIEVYNSGNEAVNLLDYSLTDDVDDLEKWRFPEVVLGAGQYLLVFASNQSSDTYVDGDGNLHTNFRLDPDGEYLALVEPDGVTVAFEYGPEFPPQLTDISYGLPAESDVTFLVDGDTEGEVLIPTNGSLGSTWTEVGFEAGPEWITDVSPGVAATGGFGFDTAAPTPNLVAAWPLDDAAGSGSAEDSSGNGHEAQVVGSVTFGQPGATAATGTGVSMSNASLDVTYSPELNPESFTFAAWARVTGGAGQFRSVVTSRFDGFPTLGGYVLYAGSNNTWQFWTGGGVNAGAWDVLTGPAVQLNTWTHVAISFDDATNTKTLYINGNPAASTTTQRYAQNASRDLHIGAGNDFGTQFRFPGNIDDASLWNAALDQTAIQSLMNQGTPEGSVVDFDPLIDTDLEAEMEGVNGSAYLRFPFTADPSGFDSLTLDIRYDDGFVAYLNGTEVARRLAPSVLAFDSTATGGRSDTVVVAGEEIDLTGNLGLLNSGENVLAIHGLNLSANDSDFLISPTLRAAVTEVDVNSAGYFETPTPGAANAAQTDNIGPLITNVGHEPAVLGFGEKLVVTAELDEVTIPVGSVSLTYRVMYGGEITVGMVDDGTGDDAEAGDGIYTGTIPANVATPGQMLRYYVSAEDADANGSREPRFIDRVGNNQSAEYFGTVVDNAAVSSNLPILQWFSQNPNAGNTRTGTRASVFYEGRFYDNIFVRQRGQATNGGSQKFDFNKKDPIWVNEEMGRVGEININAQGSDPTFIRQTLAFETFDDAGVASSQSFLTHMRVNGGFDRAGVVIEQVDEDFLERNNLDPEGALYKFVQRSQLTPVFSNVTDGVEKKTREDEDFSDLQALVDGLNLPTEAERNAFVFDNIDMPQVINYLAARAITQDVDSVRKNFYGYRDTNGNGEWSIFPWDKDWTFGVVGGAGTFARHPFLGDQQHLLLCCNQWSVLFDVMFNLPSTRELYLRRIRTLMDEMLQPPGTPGSEGLFEQRVDELFAEAAGELGGGPANAISGLKSFFPTRRNDLYNTHNIENVGGGEISTIVPEFANDVRYMVAKNGALDGVWMDQGFDDSGWSIGQYGIGYETTPADYQNLIRTDIESEIFNQVGSLYTRKTFDLANFDAISELTLRMKYDDAFVAYINGVRVASRNFSGTPVFNSTGQNHPDGAAVVFENINISSFIPQLNLQPTGNVLAIHGINTGFSSSDMLVLPELVEGVIGNDDAAGIPNKQPASPDIEIGAIEFNPGSGDQDQEYIEIVNPYDTAIDVSGWEMRGGVGFVFKPGTVIPSNGTIYLTPDSNAFRARTVGPGGGQGLYVQGGYEGHLSNFGETLELYDGDGVLVDTLSYEGAPSDAQQYLRVAELNFNPADPTNDELAVDNTLDNDDFEFVEFVNISDSVTIDLGGITFSDGIVFTFGAGSLAPGERVLIVKDLTAFGIRYETAGLDIAGEYTGSLDNGGERVKYDDADGSTIQEFEYDDGRKWPIEADGFGASIEVIDTAGDYSDADNWRASYEANGTPRGLGVGAEVNVFLVPRHVVTGGDTSVDVPATDLAHVPGGEADDFWVREGTAYFVEVWLKSDQLSGDGGAIAGGSLTLEFDPATATPVSIGFGDGFGLNQTEDLDLIEGLYSFGAESGSADLGDDEHVLFARVMFMSRNDIDPVGQVFHAVDTGLDRDAVPYAFTTVGLGGVPTNFEEKTADVESRGVIFDFDNNDVVNFGDLGFFLPAMGEVVGGSEPAYAVWADFDGDEEVGQTDLDALTEAFGKTFGDLAIPAGARTEGDVGGGGVVLGVDLLGEAEGV